MTISTTSNRKQYTANGSQDTFAYDFLVLDKDHLFVYVGDTLQTEGAGADYTVTGILNPAGGNVVFTASHIPIADAIVTIVRTVPMVQEYDYVENTKFPADSHETALDKLTMLLQQFNEMYSRVVSLAVESGYADLVMPDPEAGYFLQWKSDLSGLQNALALDASEVSITPFMETLLDDTTAEAGKATLEMSPGAIKAIEIQIGNATVADKIDITGLDRYNGDAWSIVEDLGKGETKNSITLSADGSQLTFTNITFGVSSLAGFLIVDVSRNKTQYDMLVRGYQIGNDIHIYFTAAPQDASGTGTKGGTVVDLTAAVDTGDSTLSVFLIYATVE
jgi:hypothetical protein